jgi:ribose 5-phosphate isomerase B
MRIAIGSDHAGFALKRSAIDWLKSDGHDVVDFGTDSEEGVDYVPYCAAVGWAVARGRFERGIVLGGSGQGEQLAANKVAGVRAALCNDIWLARLAREHNDANVLALGARVVTPFMANEITRLFLTTPFEGGRHTKRIAQLSEIEGRSDLEQWLEEHVPGITARGG